MEIWSGQTVSDNSKDRIWTITYVDHNDIMDDDDDYQDDVGARRIKNQINKFPFPVSGPAFQSVLVPLRSSRFMVDWIEFLTPFLSCSLSLFPIYTPHRACL